MKALLGLLALAAVGGFVYSRQAKAETPSDTLPEFAVTGDSGTDWTVRALGIDHNSEGEEIAVFLVLHGESPILQYVQYPGDNSHRMANNIMTTANDPLIMLAYSDFGIQAI